MSGLSLVWREAGPASTGQVVSLNQLSAPEMFACSQQNFTIVYLAERSRFSGEFTRREFRHSVINLLKDNFLLILYKDKYSNNSVKYISCFLW